MKPIIIQGREISENFPPYIIAELSANHNGVLEKALDNITEAKRRGADAVKLQTYSADTMTIDASHGEFVVNQDLELWKDRTLYDLYLEAYTPWEWHEEIFKEARSIGLEIFTNYNFHLQILGVLLLVATIGVVILSRRQNKEGTEN